MNNEYEKTLGIIGGMGPAATADLYSKIINLTPAKTDQEHLHIIIDSNAKIPDRSVYILSKSKGVDAPSPGPALVESAQRLENAGAEYIVMGCNTAHIFADLIAQSISVPFFGIPEITARALASKGITNITILSTAGTASAKIFDEELSDKGIDFVYAAKEHGKILHELIYSLVKSNSTDCIKNLKSQTESMLQNYIDKGFGHFILACTELPIAFDKLGLIDERFTDCTYELARFCVEYAR